MLSEHIGPINCYKPLESVETPYLRAKQEWDTRIGTSVNQAKNWRVACFSMGLISLLLVISNMYQLSQSKIVPYLIAVNEKSGEPKIIGKIDTVDYEPREQEVKYFLGQFIQSVRGVSSDAVVIKRNWLNAYKFLKKEAATLLNNITNLDKASPLNNIGEQTITMQLISIVKVGESKSYQARWNENRFSKDGGLLESYTMTAVFTLEFEQPMDIETLNVNPLGIFITNFQWNKEL